ncbi:MAG: DUF3429 domain-containing protein [Notoacmeibacter sp.]
MTNQKMAFLLMASGALPFVGAAAIAFFDIGDVRGFQADQIAVAYGAVILSFLGGIRWGNAINQGKSAILFLSVVPSLAGFLALLTNNFIGTIILIAGFTAQAIWDFLAQANLPNWFIRLRLVISAIVIASLMITLNF